MNQKYTEQKLDEFWSIDDIIPKKNSKISENTADTDTVLISSYIADPPKIHAQEEKIIMPSSRSVNSGSYSYTPDNPLISRVVVSAWPTKYYFYEKFRNDAIKYFDLDHEECCEVNFFSYIPQYTDMNKQQFAYYLWWRKNARNGRFLSASYSYVILFIYEILNLPDKIKSEDALDILCKIWMHYRKPYPHIDRYLSEWVCDLCLINELNAPLDKIGSILNDILKFSSLKEFYTGAEDNGYMSSSVSVLCSNYEWKKSKDITSENISYYEKHINEGVKFVLEKLSEKGKSIKDITSSTYTLRDAYSGSLCAYDVKKQIRVDYLSFTRNASFRLLITDIIKYIMNAVRASLGIRNRFTVKNLNSEVKEYLDCYFNTAIAAGSMYSRKKQNTSAAEESKEYEKYYEPISAALSLDYAKEVESSAWKITDILVHEYEMAEEDNTPAENSEKRKDEENIIIKGLSLIVCKNISAFSALAKANNILPDALVEAINEAAYERIGDVAIEQDEDGKYIIVEDYTEEINEWMNR